MLGISLREGVFPTNVLGSGGQTDCPQPSSCSLGRVFWGRVLGEGSADYPVPSRSWDQVTDQRREQAG